MTFSLELFSCESEGAKLLGGEKEEFTEEPHHADAMRISQNFKGRVSLQACLLWKERRSSKQAGRIGKTVPSLRKALNAAPTPGKRAGAYQ